MRKVFEDLFSELQSDIVSICLEYVNNRADKIYIYCSYENGIISSDFFYNINGKVVERHKLNDAIQEQIDKQNLEYDVSTERQDAVLNIIEEDILKIKSVCQKYDRDMPSEIKLIYNVKDHKLKAKYRYDLVYTNDPVKSADDIAMEWFDQIQTEKL
jgi:hypothetical protein